MYVKNKNIITGLLILLFCIFVFIQIQQFPQTVYEERSISAEFFPRLLTIILFLLGLISLKRGFQEVKKQNEGVKIKVDKKILLLTFIFVVSVAIYVALIKTAGFLIVTILYLTLIIKLFGTNFAKSIMISITFSTVIYYIFGYFFKVFLPAGFLG